MYESTQMEEVLGKLSKDCHGGRTEIQTLPFFTQRGYPLTSLEHDLRRVRTIGRPDALSGSERGDTPVDRYLWS